MNPGHTSNIVSSKSFLKLFKKAEKEHKKTRSVYKRAWGEAQGSYSKRSLTLDQGTETGTQESIFQVTLDGQGIRGQTGLRQ